MLQAQHSSFSIFPFLHPLKPSFAPSNLSVYSPIKPLRPARAQNIRPAPPEPWLADAQDEPTTPTVDAPSPLLSEEGPIELPSSAPSIFASSDDPNPIQSSATLLLTGSLSVFLFRLLRRRAIRAKEMRLRSSGVKKISKEDSIETLKAITPTPIDPQASPREAIVGGLIAGVVAVILYKFTTTIESSLSQQPLSDNYSARQITITIRTIINGLCYLATFVFGMNSIGLFLYSVYITLNSLSGDSTTSQDTKKERDEQLSSETLVNRSEGNISRDDIASDSPN
ncbi:unnamed protein product [Cuscuta epithymum]|uniref:Transmembrane protein n=1 Tax=Cuscuta epithymum TaxID=186058 RepID=A0AAV0GK77_9ASTE|nr:unnamed protein product [Cuscuta epithymum]